MVKTVKNNHLYKRDLTHQDYLGDSSAIRNNGGAGLLDFRISDKKVKFDKDELPSGEIFESLSEKYIIKHVAAYVVPQMLGGISFLLFIVFFYFIFIAEDDGSIPLFFNFLTFFLFFIALFFGYYYLTMPKKECIFNREDGLLTIPGLMWKPNATMPFTKAMFTYTGPSAQGLGAYKLMIMRPDKYYSKYLCSLGHTCYEDMSFFVWFMDKNRPLPPGTAFDAYRSKDFERRKSEGFPKPLFPSAFDTPEATQEQQAERLKIGGW